MTQPFSIKTLAAPSVSAILAAASLSAAAAPWTTVGSAGTVDESDLQTVVLSGAGANISSSAPLPETATLRYNLVPVDGFLANFGVFGGVQMSSAFRDNGSTAQIRLRLREVENKTGILRTILSWDSNAFPASSEFQLQSVNSCGKPGFNFDFERRSYYVEAELTKASTSAVPSLGTIQVRPVTCQGIE